MTLRFLTLRRSPAFQASVVEFAFGVVFGNLPFHDPLQKL
jgi:hypothetical protein